MNVVIYADNRFEEMAMLAGTDPIYVEMIYFSDSNHTVKRTAEAKILVTDFDVHEFHEKNIALHIRLDETQVQLANVLNEQKNCQCNKKPSRILTTEEVEAASPLNQKKLKK